MSRNLCRTDCHFCDGLVDLVGAIAPITREQCGVYFDEYEGMLVANAECVECGAKYLAWIDDPPRHNKGGWGWMTRRMHSEGIPFVDLSFRSTFNDEWGKGDLPQFEIEVVTTRTKKPLTPERLLELGWWHERWG